MNFKLSASILAFVLTASSAQAGITQAPVISAVIDYSDVLRNDIIDSIEMTSTVTRDVSIFTVAGVSLEAYILTLPLDSEVKKRVVVQLANPMYSIPLGYFLKMFRDRYTGVEQGDIFKKHLAGSYSQAQLRGFEHSLYSFDTNKPVETEQDDHGQGLQFNRELIASMVVVYDALIDIDKWRKEKYLPDNYDYLTNSEEDLKIVNKIQPILMDVLTKAAAGMDEGDVKLSLEHILQDNGVVKTNNKAQALTVTLIDFVRLNVLKGYRQYVFKSRRADALNDWMHKLLADNPQDVIKFLQAQQNRRLAVQITVDGLQQGLVEGLVNQDLPFISQAYQQHQNRLNFNPVSIASTTIQSTQALSFLTELASQPYKDDKYLPFFKRLYQSHQSSIAQQGISSTPTISVRNLPIIKTGAKVSGKQGTGIPNFHFVDRSQDRAYYFFGNDALQLDKLTADNGLLTMFDRLNHLSTLNCNAQYDWNAHVSYDALLNLGAGESQRDFGEKRCRRELSERADTELELNASRSLLINLINEYTAIPGWRLFSSHAKQKKISRLLHSYSQQAFSGMPDYLLVYNPWLDHFSHFKGPFSNEVISPTGELNRLDYWLNETEALYKKAGVYKNTLWGMAGDHGLAPVYYVTDPEAEVLQPLQQELGYTLNIKKISSDEGEGPKITNNLDAPSIKGTDIVIASTAGGNFMMDFFNAQKSWSTQPVYQELTNWRPINAPKKNAPVDIVDRLSAGLTASLDYMVLREKPCGLDSCTVRLIGTRDGQRRDEIIERRGEKIRHYSINGSPVVLLNIYAGNPYLKTLSKQKMVKSGLISKCLSSPSSWCTASQWRELMSYTARPDAVNQLIALYEEPRAGTINLFPEQGIGFNTKVPGRHAGESYLEKDAFIGFWGELVNNKDKRLPYAENGSLAPTLYQYLTGEQVQPGTNGWGYPSLLDKLDIKQQ
ncbi:alkaline phosphatase family protein [Psychromonas ossibalaenae]|uniref:alkaline phosphatase family protein n=1 Tax=Psychromonas ossibalaenae TaxID=444922 RepID=UPI00035FA76A|nr:alkaline phosphatase family protein [Psychromonas ossibalaenae]